MNLTAQVARLGRRVRQAVAPKNTLSFADAIPHLARGKVRLPKYSNLESISPNAFRNLTLKQAPPSGRPDLVSSGNIAYQAGRLLPPTHELNHALRLENRESLKPHVPQLHRLLWEGQQSAHSEVGAKPQAIQTYELLANTLPADHPVRQDRFTLRVPPRQRLDLAIGSGTILGTSAVLAGASYGLLNFLQGTSTEPRPGVVSRAT